MAHLREVHVTECSALYPVGAHIVGQGATELIAEIGLAMTLEATTAEVAATCHAHPTLSEAILESALLAEGRGINF